MSKSTIPQNVRAAIWAKAGGRCEFRACNEDLVGDLIAGKEDGLYGFIAHIVADSPGGPRGDPVRSSLLGKALSNLMLMCAKHHKLIDDQGTQDDYPEDVLHEMKDRHETRVTINCGIDEEYASHVLRFGASIGKNEALVSTQAIFAAMPPERHPVRWSRISVQGVTLLPT